MILKLSNKGKTKKKTLIYEVNQYMFLLISIRACPYVNQSGSDFATLITDELPEVSHRHLHVRPEVDEKQKRKDLKY